MVHSQPERGRYRRRCTGNNGLGGESHLPDPVGIGLPAEEPKEFMA